MYLSPEHSRRVVPIQMSAWNWRVHRVNLGWQMDWVIWRNCPKTWILSLFWALSKCRTSFFYGNHDWIAYVVMMLYLHLHTYLSSQLWAAVEDKHCFLWLVYLENAMQFPGCSKINLYRSHTVNTQKRSTLQNECNIRMNRPYNYFGRYFFGKQVLNFFYAYKLE